MIFIVFIIPFSVNIHSDGTLDRLVWRSHHAIVFISISRLATTRTDGRIEARLDGDAETLLAVRHGKVEGSDAVFIVQRIEAAIVAETAEYLHRGGYGTIDGTVIFSIIIESLHLDAFTHLQVVVLAEDILIGRIS